ncbi:hypothetical protein [Gluconobacter sp. GP1]|uniref:hypothetical protein n=1 Tax=Gluconobacter sp. GP1 TaxID=3046423 RepID=UPI00293E73E2|nr:hypothetical protein [Gluconobacter sp. GP1]
MKDASVETLRADNSDPRRAMLTGFGIFEDFSGSEFERTGCAETFVAALKGFKLRETSRFSVETG